VRQATTPIIDSSRLLVTAPTDDPAYEEHLRRLHGDAWSAYRHVVADVNQFRELEYPIHVDVEAYYGCNLRCPHCARNHSQQPDNQLMSMELYEQVIAQAAAIGTRAIGLVPWGEFLLDRDVFRKIEAARARGILDVRVHTNGTLITEAVADTIVESGVTWIGISLDAATAATYRAVRRSDFARAVSAVGYLINAKLKRGAVTPKLRVSFVSQQQNEHEADLFLATFGRFAEVTIQQYRNSMGLMEGEAFYPRSPALAYAERGCVQPFERVYVRYDGRVNPCCSDLENLLTYGSLREHSLHDLFNGPAARDLRRRMLATDLNAVCRYCMTH
jgi:sulfatase maturation enzyme AslB (radical SAM superfamily)